MYASSTTSMTTSVSRAELSGAAGERRVRVVRLLRPRRAAPAFGFSLRGGREFATGFFISKVEINSEAHLQGLKVGDQLVSVNGYRVDDAVHAELVHYLAAQSRLKVKVRYVGMVPVKDKEHESLSWHFVSERASLASDVSSSPTLCHNVDHLTDLRLSILVPPRAKLGCGICKGPDWKPGIFVQFVRDGGIAQVAGLRPGDQILSCNGQDFANVSFHEAITSMKACGRLELVVREGAGTELVSPESSGYNSSASSAAGERSPAPAAPTVALAPPAALRRRLASVAEEAADRADKRIIMNRIKRRTWDSLEFDWKSGDIHNFDAPSDIEPDYDCPSIPNNPHTYENKTNMRVKNSKNEYEPKVTSPLNRTIINLTDKGATIQCSYDNNVANKNKLSTIPTNRDSDKNTIVVEVHHMNTPSCAKSHCNFSSPARDNCNADAASISSSATLSSAIAEEIQRRKMNKKSINTDNNNTKNQLKKLNNPKSIDDDKKKHHDALMDEFKKVHRKMFVNQEPSNGTMLNDEKQNDGGNLDRQHTLPIRKADTISPEIINNNVQQRSEATDNPPPPPPMPFKNGDFQNDVPKLNFEEINLNKNNLRKTGTLCRTPTPDYNMKINHAEIKTNANGHENAEVGSIESYKLKNPLNVQPKPPPNYFVKAPNGTATMKKNVRPVSVTIGEYVNNVGNRREPSKLEFLNGDKTDGRRPADDEPISSRLQSELALTLSRSNLRKKTEALDDAIHKITVTKSMNTNGVLKNDENFYARYGNNLLPLAPSITIPKVSQLKH